MLEPTPVTELFIDGMDDEQIWSQLELRADNVCHALQYALDGMDEGVEEDESEESEDDSEEGDDRMQKLREALVRGEDIDMADLEGIEIDDEDDTEGDDEEQDDEEESDDEPRAHLGEKVVELRDPSDEEDEDEDEYGPEEDQVEEVWDAPAVDFSTFDTEMSVEYLERHPPSRPKPKSTLKSSGHPELDDGFFDLAAFNRETEEAEAKASSRGRLGKRDSDDEDEDLEDDIDMFAPIDDASGVFEEEDLEGGDRGMHTPSHTSVELAYTYLQRYSTRISLILLRGLLRRMLKERIKGRARRRSSRRLHLEGRSASMRKSKSG